ncbi:unnamed protein product [Leptosia nina]|uniref:Uncharacterized protein n=1 Tax=Leptosia nina TaxID=320188 RepID=A0AAV1J6Q2_9NEOP
MAMCRFDEVMNIYKFITAFSFIPNSMADVKVFGEVSFDIRILNIDRPSDASGGKLEVVIRSNGNNDTVDESDSKDTETVVRANDLRVTAPAIVECQYQYPEKEQVNAILSDMMNQLTKLFVKAHDVLKGGLPRRSPTRFRVVDKLDSSFFEKAFKQMASEFRYLLNNTIPVANHTGDPCQKQEQLKKMWQSLLNLSQEVLSRASMSCLQEFLRTRNRADDSQTKSKLDQLATRELNKMRSNLLDKLCDDFQMCYNDLL